MWIYKGKEFNLAPEELEKWQGFVYCITIPDGRKYIGSKNLWQKVKLKPLKGKKRKRIVVKETDWKKYFSSSETIKEDISKNGSDGYHREILILCEGKGIMAYREAELQFKHGVLFSDEYLNGIINIRLNQSTVKGHSPLI